jgi:hypothetical protein
MKTAMQELIEFVNTRCLNGDFVLEKANQLLEKEKEQIIEAYEDGKQNGMDSITNIYMYIIGEKYYNQTYNQKQHIIDIMKADEDDGLYKMFDTDSDKKH